MQTTTTASSIGALLRSDIIDAVDARALLKTVLNMTDAQIAAHPEREVADDERRQYLNLVWRRRAGQPIAYLTGEREFYSLSFRVTPAVLIPRPETELLVEAAIERARGRRGFRVLDLATGSGCVAVAIARNCADAVVTAADVSREALALARENAARHGVTIEFLPSDWFEGLSGRRFDAIVANPPYVATSDPHLELGDARFEPLRALVAGPTGLECIETIVAQAPGCLDRGGWLMFEHGYDQAPRCRELLARARFEEIRSTRDLSGIERVSGGRI
jgi:release factor glutamine methyltransferase